MSSFFSTSALAPTSIDSSLTHATILSAMTLASILSTLALASASALLSMLLTAVEALERSESVFTVEAFERIESVFTYMELICGSFFRGESRMGISSDSSSEDSFSRLPAALNSARKPPARTPTALTPPDTLDVLRDCFEPHSFSAGGNFSMPLFISTCASLIAFQTWSEVVALLAQASSSSRNNPWYIFDHTLNMSTLSRLFSVCGSTS
mmetsp:Transcript_70106/g.113852  ORF Transcript_70106/g.113852 Transcript_70106/m.113852 type:complete len:210 (-) Transcript_70106:293-922(-)